MLTRNRALSVIARATDAAIISALSDHPNKHVKHAVSHKLTLLDSLKDVDALTTQKDLKPYLTDPRSSVRKLAEEKTSFLRSEASRKAAATRKSKQQEA